MGISERKQIQKKVFSYADSIIFYPFYFIKKRRLFQYFFIFSINRNNFEGAFLYWISFARKNS